jgi:hypothetical protein
MILMRCAYDLSVTLDFPAHWLIASTRDPHSESEVPSMLCLSLVEQSQIIRAFDTYRI